MTDNKDFYALQAVIFKKPQFTLEKAEKEANNYIKNNKNKHFYRETKSSYRFRNIPKQKFIKKTFRTKNLKNGVSLVMGQLKPENHHLEGGGIFDLFKKPIRAVREYFRPRQMSYNNTTTKNLNAWGNLIIQDLTIARTPIMSILDKTINLLSFGKFDEAKRDSNYDKLFHLALIANVGQKSLVIEKNEVINVNTSYKIDKNTELMKVDLQGKKFSTNQMLNETRQRIGDKQFFLYHPFDYNCQVFIKDLLMTEGLYNQREADFLFQDLTEITKKIPSLTKKIMKFTTDMGGFFNKILGKGKMSLKDEFIMDKKNHDKKLLKFENKKPTKQEIKNTLDGLKIINNNGLEHEDKLKKMLGEGNEKDIYDSKKIIFHFDDKNKLTGGSLKDEINDFMKDFEPSKLPKKDKIEIAKKFNKGYIGSLAYIYYLLLRHKNATILFDSDNYQMNWKFHLLENKDVKILFNLTPNDFFDNLKKIKKSKKFNFVICPLTISTYEKTIGHRNILFFDLSKNTCERYEPHGDRESFKEKYNLLHDNKERQEINPSFLDIVGEKINSILNKICKDNNFTYIDETQNLPTVIDYIDEMNKDKIFNNKFFGRYYANRKEGKLGLQSISTGNHGLCIAFSSLYVDLRLQFSKYEPKDILLNLMKCIKYEPSELEDFIISYVNFLNKIFENSVGDKEEYTFEDEKQILKKIHGLIKERGIAIEDTEKERGIAIEDTEKEKESYVKLYKNDKLLLEATDINELKQLIKDNVKPPTKNIECVIKTPEQEIKCAITPKLELKNPPKK